MAEHLAVQRIAVPQSAVQLNDGLLEPGRKRLAWMALMPCRRCSFMGLFHVLRGQLPIRGDLRLGWSARRGSRLRGGGWRCLVVRASRGERTAQRARRDEQDRHFQPHSDLLNCMHSQYPQS